MDQSHNSFTELNGDNRQATLLLAWYAAKKRDLPWRKTRDPYAIWVSEVMLQQTQVKTVIPYYLRFLHHFPCVEKLASATLEEVLTVWRGLGYYSRARRLWEGARHIRDQWAGEIPKEYEALLAVPGIGKYTAGAIASIAFGRRVAAIDGNVLRVLSRLLTWSEPIETAKSSRHFNDRLMEWQPALRPGDFNQALMELGATVCTPTKPDCANCPLAQLCEAYLQGDVQRYPVRKMKTKRQEVIRLTFVLRRGDLVFLQKRPAQGLLADLWEFPGVELSSEDSLSTKIQVLDQEKWFGYFREAIPSGDFQEQVRKQFGQGIKLQGPAWYTFSHRRWQIYWVIIDLPEQFQPEPLTSDALRETAEKYEEDLREVQLSADNSCWVSRQSLDGLPLPVAFKAIVDDLRSCKSRANQAIPCAGVSLASSLD